MSGITHALSITTFSLKQLPILDIPAVHLHPLEQTCPHHLQPNHTLFSFSLEISSPAHAKQTTNNLQHNNSILIPHGLPFRTILAELPLTVKDLVVFTAEIDLDEAGNQWLLSIGDEI